MNDDVEIILAVKHKTGTYTKTETNWRYENNSSVLDGLGKDIQVEIARRTNGDSWLRTRLMRIRTASILGGSNLK